MVAYGERPRGQPVSSQNPPGQTAQTGQAIPPYELKIVYAACVFAAYMNCVTARYREAFKPSLAQLHVMILEHWKDAEFRRTTAQRTRWVIDTHYGRLEIHQDHCDCGHCKPKKM